VKRILSLTIFVFVFFLPLVPIFEPLSSIHSGPTGNNIGHSEPIIQSIDYENGTIGTQYNSYFIPNLGQLNNKDILFYDRSGSIFFSSDGFGLSSKEIIEVPIDKSPFEQTPYHIKGSMITYTMQNKKDILPRGSERVDCYSNFLVGNKSDEWITSVPSYRMIIYENVWDRIDIKYKIRESSLKYDIILKPGANPSDIGFIINGQDGMRICDNGDLEITSGGRTFLETAPLIFYADEPNERIKGGFVIHDEWLVGYWLDEYDESRTVIIDPLVMSTFIGGSLTDTPKAMDVDNSGNVYVTGYTISTDFPVHPGSFDQTYGGNQDVFIFKLSSDYTTLDYCTYIGGAKEDTGNDIVVDTSGYAFITGHTTSTDFPFTDGSYDTTWGDPYDDTTSGEDCFVIKLDNDGSSLTYGTFLGGGWKSSDGTTAYPNQYGKAIDIDPSGNAYVVGETYSKYFPVDSPAPSGAFDTTYESGTLPIRDCFLTKFNSDGSDIIYSTYFGGGKSGNWAISGDDQAYEIIVDKEGYAYAAGRTASNDFPTENAAYGSLKGDGGSYDGFVLKMNKLGSGLVFSTYIGGGSFDYLRDLCVDGSGYSYITGYTNSDDYPTTSGAYKENPGSLHEIFVTKLNISGDKIIYSTFITRGEANAIKDDGKGNVYVATSGDKDFPVTNRSYSWKVNGGSDAVLFALNYTGGNLTYGTFIGGSAGEVGNDLYLHPSGDVYLMGTSSSSDFPVTTGAVDNRSKGSGVFISRLNLTLKPSEPANLTVGSGDSYVKLNWDPPLYDDGHAVTKYKVYRGTNESVLSLIFELNSTSTEINDTGLTNGRTHYYYVTAISDIGEGPETNMVNATPLKIPSKPVNLSSDWGDTWINLTWKPPEDNGGAEISNYSIFRGINEGTLVRSATIGNRTWYKDTGLINGKYYVYAITAHNSVGEGPLSNSTSDIPKRIPSEPLDLSIDWDDQQLSLSWSPPLNNGGAQIDSYMIYKRIGETELNPIQFGNVTRYNDTEVSNGIEYTYSISAMNIAGEGPRSSEESSIPKRVPDLPRNLKAYSGDGYITIDWLPPLIDGGSTITGYVIYSSIDDKNYTKLVSLGVTNKYNDTGLINGQTYYYRLSAVNFVGEGDTSSPVSEVPSTIPGTPENLRVMELDRALNLSWDPPFDDGGADIINYWVEIKGPDMVTGSLVSGGTHHRFTGLTNGIEYTSRVRAVNMRGEGPFSFSINGTPFSRPSKITNFQLELGEGYVLLTWEPPMDEGTYPILGYRIFRGVEINNLTILFNSTTELNFNDTEVDPNTTYQYQICAHNRGGNGIPSEIRTVRTPPFEEPIGDDDDDEGPEGNSPPESLNIETNSNRLKKGEILTLTASAYDPDGDDLSFSWSLDTDPDWYATGNPIEVEGLNPGDHTFSLFVSDGHNNSTSQIKIKVEDNEQGGTGSNILFILIGIMVILIILFLLLFFILKSRRGEEVFEFDEEIEGGIEPPDVEDTTDTDPEEETMEMEDEATLVMGSEIDIIEEPTKEMDMAAPPGIHKGLPNKLEDYEMDEHIQSGAFADVFLARSVNGDEVAVKIPRSAVIDDMDQKVKKKFIKEAKNWKKIYELTNAREGIVGIYGYGLKPKPYIIMEYMSKGNLRSHMKDLTFDEKLECFTKVCRTIAKVHKHEIIHRDIKPENILLSDESEWKIGDWGLSKILLESSGSITQAGTIKGTISYCAPEQIQPEEFGKPDRSTDIYQLGVLAYELFTGERPFKGEPAKVMFDIIRENPVHPSEVDPEVPVYLGDAVMRAMLKRKRDRFRSALDLIKAVKGEF